MRLRSLTVVAAILLGITSPASGLDFGVGAQVVGLKHTLTGNLPTEGEWHGDFGFGGGLSFDLAFTEDVALSFQPTYTPRRSFQTLESAGEEISRTDFDFRYLSLPLLCRVTSDPGGVRGFVTAGLSMDILLSAEATTNSQTTDIESRLDEFTIGALFGVGMMIPVAGHSLLIELRYEQGLDDLVDRSTPPIETYSTDETPSVKYRLLMLQVGFLFGLGGE